MSLNEVAKRPCLAVCVENRSYGVIVLSDGTHSEEFYCITDGKRILDKLVSAGKISKDDSERIEDHFNASDIPRHTEPLLAIFRIPTAEFSSSQLGMTHRHTCGTCGHVWEHGSKHEDSVKAHTCEKCGDQQWIIG